MYKDKQNERQDLANTTFVMSTHEYEQEIKNALADNDSIFDACYDIIDSLNKKQNKTE